MMLDLQKSAVTTLLLVLAGGAVAEQSQDVPHPKSFTDRFKACSAERFSGVGEDTEIDVSLHLGPTGVLSDAPVMAEEPKATPEERRLFWVTHDALRACLPMDSGDGFEVGTMTLRVSPRDVQVVKANVSLSDGVNVSGRQGDYREPPGVAGVSVAEDSSQQTEDELELSRGKRREIQRRLTLIGYDTQGADGVFGQNSRTAISEWQEANDLSVTGFLNGSQLAAIERSSAEQYAAWEREQAAKRERAVKPKKKSTSTRKKQRVKVCNRGVLGLLYNCRYEWR